MAEKPELTEDLFRLLTEHATDFIRLHSLEGRTIYSSESAKALFGKSPFDLFDPVHPEDLPRARNWWKRVVAGQSERIQGRLRDGQGKWLWVEGAASLVELKDGKYVLSVCREVSEQKEAEEILRRSERVLREAEQLGHTGSWEHDVATGRTFSSEENLRLFFGTTLGKGGQIDDYADAIHPDDREYVLRRHEQLLAQGGPRDIEYRVVWPDGSIHVIFGRATVVRNEAGEPIRVYGTNVDVTERKAAEEALLRSERDFSTLAEKSLQAIQIYQDGRVIYANPATSAMNGYTLDELTAMSVEQYVALVHPLDRAMADDRARRRLSGEVLRPMVEMRIIRKDGEIRWIEAFNNPIEFRGRPALLSTSIDITERKRAEELLQDRERRLSEAERVAHLGYWECDFTTDNISWSEETSRIFGRPLPDPPSVERVREMIHPDDRHIFDRALESGRRGEDSFQFAYRIIRPNGEIRYVEKIADVVKDESGRAVRAVGAVQDVTERKQAEEALRRAEELFRAIVQDQGEMIVRWKPGGVQTFVNQAYCRTYGKTYEECVGTSFWPTIVEPYRTQEQERINKLTPESPFSTGVHQSVTADGKTIWTEWTDRAIYDSDGTLVEYQSVGRDITERKRADEALRESADQLHHLSRRLLEVQEEERRRLSRELHDEFGQLIASISLQLHAARSLAGDAAKSRLDECVSLLRRASTEMRNLALELRPTMLETAGLDAALRWLVEQHERQTGINFEIKGRLDDVTGDLATACFRVIQEALTNVVRHANAKRVSIELKLRDHFIDLLIRDDGDGFDMAKTLDAAAKRGSLGLLGMRERVEILGGRLEIDSHPGDGTRIHVSLPVPDDTEAEK